MQGGLIPKDRLNFMAKKQATKKQPATSIFLNNFMH